MRDAGVSGELNNVEIGVNAAVVNYDYADAPLTLNYMYVDRGRYSFQCLAIT